jgi:transposase
VATGHDIRAGFARSGAGGAGGGTVGARGGERFAVSASYVAKADRRRRCSGETRARRSSGRPAAKILAHLPALAARIAEQPDATLAELRGWLLAECGVAVGLVTVWRALRRLGVTLKETNPGGRAGSSGRSRGARRLAGDAAYARSCAVGVPRRELGRHQPDPPLRPRAVRRAGRGGGAARPSQDHHFRCGIAPRWSDRAAGAGRSDERREFPCLCPPVPCAQPARRRHRGHGQSKQPQGARRARSDRGRRRNAAVSAALFAGL